MRRIIIALAILAATPAAAELTIDRMQYGRFGTVTVYRETAEPANVVLFISGDGGWNKGVVDMAISLASLDSLVVGININYYLAQMQAGHEQCAYPAADFELLSKFVQQKMNFHAYVPPVLVGYSSGATLAYALLAQAPAQTFRASISLGFCPDLVLRKTLCKGFGLEAKPNAKHGYTFLPVQLSNPWVALQGEIDQVCDARATDEFVKQTGRAEIVLLPKVGHGFSVQANWMPQFKQVFKSLVKTEQAVKSEEPSIVADLPLAVVPAAKTEGELMAVIVTGDGGWAGIDEHIGNYLAKKGVPVVGLNTLQYYWNPHTPEESAKALERILNYYLAAWKKEKAILIGYSMGADVLPFMADRLPKELLDKVQMIALLGPEKNITFEFHFSDLVIAKSRSTDLPVLPEVEKLAGKKIICIYGENESESLCHIVNTKMVTLIKTPDGHHFGGNYDKLAETILEHAK